MQLDRIEVTVPARILRFPSNFVTQESNRLNGHWELKVKMEKVIQTNFKSKHVFYDKIKASIKLQNSII